MIYSIWYKLTMEPHESELTPLWDLSTDVRPNWPAIGSLVLCLCSSYLSMCLVERAVTSTKMERPLKYRQSLILYSQNLAQSLFYKSRSPYAGRSELNLFREILGFPIGEYWKGGCRLSGPEESRNLPPFQPLQLGWLFTKLWRRKKGWVGAEAEEKIPIVKGYCLLHFCMEWEHLIQMPRFTGEERDPEQITWREL